MAQPYPYPSPQEQLQQLPPYPNGSNNAFQRPYLDHEQSPRMTGYTPAEDPSQQAQVGAPQPPGPDATQKEYTPKANRLRKACDSCSVRKVKCDEAGPPCRACAALDIPCTYERPSRRRGPPNKHAEAIKRQRLDGPAQSSPYESAPNTPAQIYQAHPSASASAIPAILCADSICPIELVQLLIDDFFTYVHPLCPFPHEPSFREAFRDRKDLSDRSFLALLASMIGALIAQFPRRPRKHLRTIGKLPLFPSSADFVEHCQRIVIEARGPGYLEGRELTVYDAATSYFLVSMNTFMYRWGLCNLYLGECLTILRTLGFTNPRPAYPPMDAGNTAIMDGQTPNFITEEVGRRIFWVVFVTVRSAKTFMLSLGDTPIRTPTPTQGYPPLPVEVDDQYIHSTHIERQPHGVGSIITGFNLNARIYRTVDSLVALENAYAIDQVLDLERYKRVLRDSIQRVKQVTEGTSNNHFVWHARSPSLGYDVKEETEAGLLHPPNMQDPTSLATSAYADKRRHIGYEIQKANVQVSYLSCRSFYLEKYWALCESVPSAKDQATQDDSGLAGANLRSPPMQASGGAQSPSNSSTVSSNTAAELRAERESIANDLLNVLSHIRPVHMEPNSVSFCMKVRAIAGTLLPETNGDGAATGQNGNDEDAISASYLRTFLELLTDLEKSGSTGMRSELWGRAGHSHEASALAALASAGAQSLQDEDEALGMEDEEEEAELRRWAGLREQQKEFVTRAFTSL